jgi:xylan 1,4-beta-xylosidase
MGSPQHPTPDQIQSLRSAAQLQLLTSPNWLEVHDGTATLTTTMPRESVSLLTLDW